MRVAEVFSLWDDPVYPGMLRGMRADLAARGVEFFVIARRASSEAPDRLVEEGLVVHQVGWRGSAVLAPLVDLFLVPWQTLRILAREPHDLVHYQFGAVDYNLLALAAPFLRRPLYLTFQGCHVRESGHPIWRALCRGLVRRAARVSAVSAALLADVARLYPEAAGKLELIRNGVDVSFFDRPAAARSGRPYLLSVGRLAAYKGHDLLLFAFLDLLRDGRDLDLVLCGAENDEGHVRGLIRALGLEDRVRLAGVVPREEVRALLHGCEAMALASREEGFSFAIVEALAAGRAVVATAKGGALECLAHERNALLFPEKDVAALADCLRRVLDDAPLRARLERGAAESARAFDRRAMSLGYEAWFAAVA